MPGFTEVMYIKCFCFDINAVLTFVPLMTRINKSCFCFVFNLHLTIKEPPCLSYHS